MQIYDNVLTSQTFQRIRDVVFSENFPWFYINTAYKQESEASLFGYSYFHNAMMNGKPNSPIGEMFELAVTSMLDAANENIDYIHRIRVGMITVTNHEVIHPAHVDFDFPHKTGLFYLNNCDGDTLMYNERYDPSLKSSSFEQYQNLKNNFTIEDRVTPRANRLVCFDGFQYHSSSTPKTVDRRIVINFNYVTKTE
jgi:hypothetical protein